MENDPERQRLLEECDRMREQIEAQGKELQQILQRCRALEDEMKRFWTARDTEARYRAALEEVLAHRAADPDGNHVCWIGEGTFARVEAALKPDDGTEET